MPAGQRSGSGSQSELNDEQVRKEDILSNRDKAQRRPGQSLDGIGVQVDEYKDVPTNQRGDAQTKEAQHKDGGRGLDTVSSRDTDAPEAQSPATDAKDKKPDSSYPRRAD